jgi:hypothetical protein
VWSPSPETVNVVANGSVCAVFVTRVNAPPSMRYSVQSTPVPEAPSLARSVTWTGLS